MNAKISTIIRLSEIVRKLREVIFSLKNLSKRQYDPELTQIEADLENVKKDVEREEMLHPEFATESILFNQLGCFWFKDREGRFVLVNKAYAELCGKSDASELYGKTDFDVWPEHLATQYLESDQEIIKTATPLIIEEKIVKSKDSDKWLEIHKAPVLNSENEVIGIAGYLRDITTRKNALETVRKLSLAIEQSSVSVIITDINGNIEYVNPKFLEITGYTNEQVVGKNPRILKSGKTSVEEYAHLWQTISSGNVWNGEFCNKKANGDLFWEKSTISPVKNEKGIITNYVAIKEDITELKRKDQDILNITGQLQLITENIGEVFALLDAECDNIYYVSPAFERIFGRRIKETMTMGDFFNTVMSEDVEFVRIILDAYKKGGDFDVEFRIVRPDREMRWIHARIYPVKDNFGNIQRHTGIANDITRQKIIEDTLRKSEEKYRLITESSSDVIWVYNLNQNKFTFISSAIQLLRGITVEEAMKEKLTDSFSVESMKVMNKLVSRNATRFFAPGQPGNNYSIDEVQQFHKDGHLIWIEISSMLQYNQQGQSELVGISRDITKRKKTERELERLNKLQDVLVNMSLNYINMKFDDIDENIIQSLRDLGRFIDSQRAMIFTYHWDQSICTCNYEWHEDEFITLKQDLANVPLSQMPEWIAKHKNAEIFEIQNVEIFFGLSRDILLLHEVKSTINIPLMIDSKAIGFISFDSLRQHRRYTDKEKSLLAVFAQLYVNLLQRRELENGLIQEKERAQKANKAKSEFLANMSHELRTPLNGVIGFSELLAQTNLNEVQRHYANAINTSANSLLGVINDILDFSKIEANRMELEIVKTDIVKIIEQSVEVISPLAEKKHLELLLSIDPALPKYAFVDPIRLSQILANLLSNAVKFTAKGEVELRVRYRSIDENHGHVCFDVRDTGIGITDEQRLKLFKAFSQADSSTTRKFGGTGLGLIISELIARKMGGKIDLKSEKDKGTTFYLSIDVQTEQAFDELQFPQISSPVLIIDDNKQSAQNIENLLRQGGIKVVACESANEAVMILQFNKDFEIILVDNMIHKSNGIESVQLICDKIGIGVNDKHFVIMHSSSDDYLFYEECNEVGINNFLAKPVKMYELKTVFNSIMNNKKESIENNVNTKAEPVANKKYRILVADDDLFNLMLAKAMISNIMPNVEIIEATTGKEALQKYKNGGADLIFMDVQMPEMDGNEATIAIREYEGSTGMHVPVVGLTAGALKQEKEKCLQAGMDEFLTKPIDSAKLKSTLDEFLN